MSSAAPSSAPSSAPSGLASADRFSPITQDDHAGYLWIATLLAAIYAIFSILVRSYIKRSCFGADDVVCVVATMFGTGAFVAIFVGLGYGLGKSSGSVDATQLQDIGEAVFASRILWITASIFAKCSVVLLIRRLFSGDMNEKRTICDVVLVLIALWGLGSIVAVSARCDVHHLVESDGRCSAQFARWAFIGIYDAVLEVTIFLLSFILVWGLTMGLDPKVRVILAFIFRLPLIAITLVHLFTIKWTADSVNLNFEIVPALVCEQIELGYSLISATIPNLKSFIMSFNTSMMMDIGHKLHSQPPSHTDLSSRLGSSSERAPRLSDIESRETFIRGLRPEAELRHFASIQHMEDMDEDESAGNLDRESQDRIIRRDIRWTVEESPA